MVKITRKDFDRLIEGYKTAERDKTRREIMPEKKVSTIWLGKTLINSDPVV